MGGHCCRQLPLQYGAGWDWLLIWDLCETTGGSLRGSWERQNLIGWEHPGRFHHACGPISSVMVNKFGPRLTCIAGACVSAVAIFVSTFSPNVYMLMISYGIVGGLGLGLMYVPAVTAVGYWFEKKRSLVTGISTCGSGFGTIVFAPVVTALLQVSNWQWTNM